MKNSFAWFLLIVCGLSVCCFTHSYFKACEDINYIYKYTSAINADIRSISATLNDLVDADRDLLDIMNRGDE